jgi:hypothetical protein
MPYYLIGDISELKVQDIFEAVGKQSSRQWEN